MEGKANGVADWLRRYPVISIPSSAPIFHEVKAVEISMEARLMDPGGHEHFQAEA